MSNPGTRQVDGSPPVSTASTRGLPCRSASLGRHRKGCPSVPPPASRTDRPPRSGSDPLPPDRRLPEGSMNTYDPVATIIYVHMSQETDPYAVPAETSRRCTK